MPVLAFMVRNSIPQRETREITVENVRVDARTVELSFSSEHPVQRGWGTEILSHEKESVDLSRLNSGAAALLDHDPTKFVGKVESARIAAKRGKATIRFGKSALANEVWQDVQDGVRQLVSVGYTIDQTEDLGSGSYRVTKWTPYEISFVSVPADPNVGVGRSHPMIDTMPDDNNDNFSKLCGLRSNDCTASQEQVRRREIEALGEAIGKPDAIEFAKRAIVSGLSVNEYRAEILKNMKPIELIPASDTRVLGLDPGHSFTRHNPVIGMDGRQRSAYQLHESHCRSG
jgi:hypothetical protein